MERALAVVPSVSDFLRITAHKNKLKRNVVDSDDSRMNSEEMTSLIRRDGDSLSAFRAGFVVWQLNTLSFTLLKLLTRSK